MWNLFFIYFNGDLMLSNTINVCVFPIQYNAVFECIWYAINIINWYHWGKCICNFDLYCQKFIYKGISVHKSNILYYLFSLFLHFLKGWVYWSYSPIGIKYHLCSRHSSKWTETGNRDHIFDHRLESERVN